ncbi:MAG: hypothetical protein JWM47_3754 [Acidimicrobiales bacterium]|nr:hypothetical protein [Acidimicrobiales bacterium]
MASDRTGGHRGAPKPFRDRCPAAIPPGYLDKHPDDQDLIDHEAWARLKR